MERIGGGRLPVISWAPSLEEGALQQAVNCAELPVAFHHVAVMADGHQGYGVPIGAVVALRGAIAPYAVGNDIGCGMALVPTTLSREDLLRPLPTRSGGPGPAARDEVMGEVQRTVPAGPAEHRDPRSTAGLEPLLDEAFDAMEEASATSGLPLSTSSAVQPPAHRALDRAAFRAKGRRQGGTLGSGNHFIEVVAGPDDDLWVMLHSGSRGVGGWICANFHRMALAHCEALGHRLADPGLAWLPLAGDDRWDRVGRCYERALRAALGYAEQNRRLMLEAVGRILEQRFPGAMAWDGLVDIHHNDATAEDHFDASVWVHRKGAVKAAAGTATVIPGSMGTGSFLGRGLGERESFSSCSHGAGRALSRGAARRELSLADQLALVEAAGGKVYASDRAAVLDEMPGAYKDLDEVMANQADLVETVRRFTPLGTYKGAEKGRRKRDRAKTWRPEEER